MARPDIAALFAGLVPQLPEGVDRVLPAWQPEVVLETGEVQEGKVDDRFWPVTAMVGTTFSVAGAFYQSYLVRQKGWTRSDLRQGFVDSAVGICALGLMTMMIMVTAAAVLYGKSDVQGISSVSDMALQLEPAFGRGAVALFCMGIFAGAFSSLLANAMIGGSMLSDGLGLGGYIDQRWPKFFTVLALAVGLNVAIAVKATGDEPVNMIIFAQAMTVLGFPVLAGAMLWLATRSDLSGDRWIPLWMKIFGCVALAVTVFMAARTAVVRLLPVYEPLQKLLSL
jgi:manganese transport protein